MIIMYKLERRPEKGGAPMRTASSTKLSLNLVLSAEPFSGSHPVDLSGW